MNKITLSSLASNTDLFLGTMVATMDKTPFFYCEKDEISKELRMFLAEQQIEEINLVTSKGNMSPMIEKELSQKGIQIHLFEEEKPYELSVRIAKEFFPHAKEFIFLNPSYVEEAIPVPGLCLQKNAPPLFVDYDSIPPTVEEYLRNQVISHVDFYGDETQISSTLEGKIQQLKDSH